MTIKTYRMVLVNLTTGEKHPLPQVGTKRELLSLNGFYSVGGSKGMRRNVSGYVFRFERVGVKHNPHGARIPAFRAQNGAKFSVNTYSRGQSYGGPEEGGWWYHNQGCIENRQFRTLRAAQRYLAKLRRNAAPFTDTVLCSKREKVSEWQDGGLAGFSVLDGYGEGLVYEIEPHALPARNDTARPHYE